MNIKKIGLFIILFCLVLTFPVTLGGCIRNISTSSTPSTDSDDNLEILYQQAEGYYNNRFYTKALERYLNVYESDPNSRFAAPSLYKIGGIYMKSEKYEKAILYFDKLTVEHPRSTFANESHYNKGYCYLKIGDADRAIASLEDYLNKSKARHKGRARIYLAQSQAAIGDYYSALVSYTAAEKEKLKKETLVEILTEVKTLIDEHATTEDIIKASKDSYKGHISDYINFRLALIHSSNNENARALSYLKSMDFARSRFSFYREADKLRARLSHETVTPDVADTGKVYRIGVILPLSGKFSVFGEQVLQGMMQGVDFFGSRTLGGAKIEVIIKDSKGEQDAAAEAVRELAENPDILAIVGPLMKQTSLRAAQEAQSLGIPIIVLSTLQDICDTGDWVFRNAMTLDLQVKTLIRYANIQKGCHNFAILYPETKLGKAYAKRFAKYIDPMKQEITASVSYDPETTDFRHHVRKIKGGGPFDAIFIPDNADRIALLAPQLVYFGIKDKVLLGTPSWNRDDLAARAGGYLEDTVIVDSFYVNSDKPMVSAFVTSYKEEFGQPPSHLSGHGYDIVGILADLFKKGFGDGRASVRTGLLGVYKFPGVTGETTFMENGDISKDLALLRVGPTGIEELF